MSAIFPNPADMTPVWAWYIDVGPFTDRLGAAAVLIDLSTEPGVIAVRTDLNRRKWINLHDPRVAAGLLYLAGQPHPVLGTLTVPLLTVDAANIVITTPVSPAENLALRKLYFNGQGA